MGWSGQPLSMEYDDDDLIDRYATSEPTPPDYPTHLLFTIAEADLTKAAGEGGSPGDVMKFSAMGEVTACHTSRDNSRVELQLGEFAGDDGKFFDLSQPAYICLCDRELSMIGLDADCEVGDTIHLIGEARLESVSRAQYGETASLQVVSLSFENESDESRDG